MSKQQTALDIVIVQLKEQIEKSAHKDAGTIRTVDYRIGLTKAIEFCDKAKEMEKEKMTNAIVESMKNKFRVYTESGLEHFIEIAEQYYNETYGGKNESK